MSVLWILSVCLPAYGREISKYEPPAGRVVHGLGQYIPTIYTHDKNWQHVQKHCEAVGERPVLYSVYTALDRLAELLDSTDFVDEGFIFISDSWDKQRWWEAWAQNIET